MKNIFFISLFFTVTLSLSAQVQNTDPILSMEIRTFYIDTTADGTPALPSTIVYHTHMIVSLTDMTSVLKLYVKLGTSSGSGDLLTKTFDFDVSGNLGGGISYSRSDTDIDLGLGDYTGLYKYFSSVQVERTDHTLTDVVPFSR